MAVHGRFNNEGDALAGLHSYALSSVGARVASCSPDLASHPHLADRMTGPRDPRRTSEQCLGACHDRHPTQEPDPYERLGGLHDRGDPDDRPVPWIGKEEDGQQNGADDPHGGIVAELIANAAPPSVTLSSVLQPALADRARGKLRARRDVVALEQASQVRFHGSRADAQARADLVIRGAVDHTADADAPRDSSRAPIRGPCRRGRAALRDPPPSDVSWTDEVAIAVRMPSVGPGTQDLRQ